MNQDTILDGLDPEVMDHMASRRDMVRGAGSLASKLALASVPLGLAALAKNVFAQGGLPQNIVDVLNFALILEELEAEFYAIGTGVRAAPSGTAVDAALIPASDRAIFATIREHEITHVNFLRSALGSAAVAKPTFDFTAGGTFTPFTNYAQFLVLSQGFEDLGVRAYKGQAGNLISNKDILTAALTIHSVEARHASEVRRLRGERANMPEQAPYKGWITLRSVDAVAQPIAPIYGPGTPPASFPAEDNVTQATVNTASLTAQGITINANSASEAFDEPLDRATVIAIADPFVVTPLS